MKLELVSLTGLKYSGDAYEVVIPTAAGEIAVYPDHMPLISLAAPGVLTVRQSKDDADANLQYYATLGGVVQIDGDIIRLLVDEVEHADELYEDEVRQAYEKAQKLKAEATNAVDIEKAQALMDRHAIRLRVAELKRHNRPRR